MPFLGVITLAGIVINNAIVLIDRMEIEMNELKRSEEDAVIAACLQRFRPILLATFTTVLGLIPLYLSGGEMGRYGCEYYDWFNIRNHNYTNFYTINV